MAQASGTQLLTVDEFVERFGNDKFAELVDGEVRHLMAPAGDSSAVAMHLGTYVRIFVGSRGLGLVTTTDGSYVVSRIPRAVVLQPDVGFVRMERVADPETTRSAIEGAPDLAVEVRSPSDVVLEIEGKIGRYLRAGTRLAWLVDPLRQRVTVWRAGEAEPAVLTTDDVLEGHDVLPGFRLPVREVFNTRGAIRVELVR